MSCHIRKKLQRQTYIGTTLLQVICTCGYSTPWLITQDGASRHYSEHLDRMRGRQQRASA
jgi:hypothetical protein